MRWNCIPKARRVLQILPYYLNSMFFTVFMTLETSSPKISITLSQNLFKLCQHWGRYRRYMLPWAISEKISWCRAIRTKLINVMTSLRCYDNSDVKITLVITNFHLYLIQLWWSFFDGIVNDSLVSSQTWAVLPLKNPVEPQKRKARNRCFRFFWRGFVKCIWWRN